MVQPKYQPIFSFQLTGFCFDLKTNEARELESWQKSRIAIDKVISDWETKPVALYELDKLRNAARSSLV